MKLILIKNHRDQLVELQKGLLPHYHVDVATTGYSGLHDDTVRSYDLVLVDGTQHSTSLQVCENIRQAGALLPILVLTDSEEPTSGIELLDAGADDFLAKPIHIDQLRAHIRALLRRQTASIRRAEIRIGDLVLNTDTRDATRAGRPLDLRRKEFEILEYMMHHPDTTLTRSRLIEHIWDRNDELWANTVDVHIKNLRDKLDRPFSQSFIKTVYGLGYKLEAPATHIADGAKLSPSNDPLVVT